MVDGILLDAVAADVIRPAGLRNSVAGLTPTASGTPGEKMAADIKQLLGGIAPGIDRIVMLLCGEENLREVVLFPMNQRAEDLLMGAPSEVSPKQLRELHIRLNLPEKS